MVGPQLPRPLPNIDVIEDYVFNDKPISSSTAKAWLRYLLEERQQHRFMSGLLNALTIAIPLWIIIIIILLGKVW